MRWTRRQSVGRDKRSGLQFLWGGAGNSHCARVVRTLKRSPRRPIEPWFCPLDPPCSLPTNRDGQEKIRCITRSVSAVIFCGRAGPRLATRTHAKARRRKVQASGLCVFATPRERQKLTRQTGRTVEQVSSGEVVIHFGDVPNDQRRKVKGRAGTWSAGDVVRWSVSVRGGAENRSERHRVLLLGRRGRVYRAG